MEDDGERLAREAREAEEEDDRAFERETQAGIDERLAREAREEEAREEEKGPEAGAAEEAEAGAAEEAEEEVEPLPLPPFKFTDEELEKIEKERRRFEPCRTPEFIQGERMREIEYEEQFSTMWETNTFKYLDDLKTVQPSDPAVFQPDAEAMPSEYAFETWLDKKLEQNEKTMWKRDSAEFLDYRTVTRREAELRCLQFKEETVPRRAEEQRAKERKKDAAKYYVDGAPEEKEQITPLFFFRGQEYRLSRQHGTFQLVPGQPWLVRRYVARLAALYDMWQTVQKWKADDEDTIVEADAGYFYQYEIRADVKNSSGDLLSPIPTEAEVQEFYAQIRQQLQAAREGAQISRDFPIEFLQARYETVILGIRDEVVDADAEMEEEGGQEQQREVAICTGYFYDISDTDVYTDKVYEGVLQRIDELEKTDLRFAKDFQDGVLTYSDRLPRSLSYVRMGQDARNGRCPGRLELRKETPPSELQLKRMQNSPNYEMYRTRVDKLFRLRNAGLPSAKFVVQSNARTMEKIANDKDVLSKTRMQIFLNQLPALNSESWKKFTKDSRLETDFGFEPLQPPVRRDVQNTTRTLEAGQTLQTILENMPQFDDLVLLFFATGPWKRPYTPVFNKSHPLMFYKTDVFLLHALSTPTEQTCTEDAFRVPTLWNVASLFKAHQSRQRGYNKFKAFFPKPPYGKKTNLNILFNDGDRYELPDRVFEETPFKAARSASKQGLFSQTTDNKTSSFDVNPVFLWFGYFSKTDEAALAQIRAQENPMKFKPVYSSQDLMIKREKWMVFRDLNRKRSKEIQEKSENNREKALDKADDDTQRFVQFHNLLHDDRETRQIWPTLNAIKAKDRRYPEALDAIQIASPASENAYLNAEIGENAMLLRPWPTVWDEDSFQKDGPRYEDEDEFLARRNAWLAADEFDRLPFVPERHEASLSFYNLAEKLDIKGFDARCKFAGTRSEEGDAKFQGRKVRSEKFQKDLTEKLRSAKEDDLDVMAEVLFA